MAYDFNFNLDGTTNTPYGMNSAATNMATLNPAVNATTPQTDSWNSFNGIFGGTDAQGNFNQGWLSPTVGAAGVLANSWLGFQQLGLARDQLGMQREAWQMQKEEFDYQRDRRSAEEAAYAEARNNQAKGAL
ncbi:hypothetical protein [Vibrio phage vB_VhaP_PG11]|nr:hypothetical protein [Vibrio phage vB_VhaP_PG11]